jgi:hypothetical protein
MGTSKSYRGPMDGHPLLPPNAPPPLQDGREDIAEIPIEDRPSWASVKGAMTRFAKSGKTGQAARDAVRDISSSYVKAHGGARATALSAEKGRAGARNLGAFLGQMSTGGLGQVLRTWGLASATGQSVDVLLDQLLNVLSPVGESLEAEITRLAMAKTLDEVLENAMQAGGLDALDNITEAEAIQVLGVYLTHYINTRIMQALSDRNEAKSGDATRAASVESEVRDFVRDVVILDLREVDTAPGIVLQMDWQGEAGRAFVDRIFVVAFKLLQDCV